MLCTNCNSHVKPVVAIDIDGTMGRYHEHFLAFAEQYLGSFVSWGFRGGDASFKEWFCTAYKTTPDVWHDVRLAYRQGGMKRSMPTYAFSDSICREVIARGAELWVTTTRPYIRHDNIDPDTREWLRRNHIYYHYLLYDGHKYKKLEQLAGAERVCAVLDDLREEHQEAVELFGRDAPIIRRNIFNEADENPWQIDEAVNLDIALHMIEGRIDRWKEQHAHD